MKFKTIKSKQKQDVTVNQSELLTALGLDPNVWVIHGVYVSTLDTEDITFGVSKREYRTEFSIPETLDV